MQYSYNVVRQWYCVKFCLASQSSYSLVAFTSEWRTIGKVTSVSGLFYDVLSWDHCIGTAEGQSKAMHQCLENIAISRWFINVVFPKSIMIYACGGVTLCTNKPKWRCFVCKLFSSSRFRKILSKCSFIWFLGSAPQIRVFGWFILGYTLHK